MDKMEQGTQAAPKKSASASPALSVVPTGSALTVLGHGAHARNPGTALKPEWFDSVQVNLSATERRAATLGGRPR